MAKVRPGAPKVRATPGTKSSSSKCLKSRKASKSLKKEKHGASRIPASRSNDSQFRARGSGRNASQKAPSSGRSHGASAAAKDFINRSAEDPRLWGHLLAQPEVADFVRKSLMAKVSRDVDFAESVACASLPRLQLSPPAADHSADSGGSMSDQRQQSGLSSHVGPTTQDEARKSTLEAQRPPGRDLSNGGLLESPSSAADQPSELLKRRRRLSRKQLAPVSASSSSSCPESSAASSASSAAAAASLHRRPMQEEPLNLAQMGQSCSSSSRAVHFSQLSSLMAQLHDVHVQKLGLSRPMLKLRQGVPSRASSPSVRPARPAVDRPFKQLPTEVAATVMSFVDFQTKVLAGQRVSAGFKQVMQTRSAWEPLLLDKLACKALLRQVKQKDPLGCFAADVNRTKRLFPKGMFEVMTLETVLMDPEKLEPMQSDTEDESPKPRPLTIPDPLDELCKRLRHYFNAVTHLSIRNIEDYRMDYRFVSLRCGSLEDFGSVELLHCDSTPPTYELRASRNDPPQVINLLAIAAQNRARLPPQVKFEVQTTISEREALYLTEHLSAYKNGNDFHMVHAFYRTVRSHGVRKRYKSVVAALRQRFPEHFGSSRLDPNTPSAEGDLAAAST
ncbi:unnamed protein product [Polarella glacialis]|uniref:F-box domain-containing protein n=1 Tax=Polarella glacialis TaxID=89957 RepID=A0A813FCA6_POLGL|nr:unnamed protein product [Polarella glacialis]